MITLEVKCLIQCLPWRSIDVTFCFDFLFPSPTHTTESPGWYRPLRAQEGHRGLERDQDLLPARLLAPGLLHSGQCSLPWRQVCAALSCEDLPQKTVTPPQTGSAAAQQRAPSSPPTPLPGSWLLRVLSAFLPRHSLPPEPPRAMPGLWGHAAQATACFRVTSAVPVGVGQPGKASGNRPGRLCKQKSVISFRGGKGKD